MMELPNETPAYTIDRLTSRLAAVEAEAAQQRLRANQAEHERDELRERLRKLAGSDDHPEHRCEWCGGRNISWFADSELWNTTVRAVTDGADLTLCPICFAKLAEERQTVNVGAVGYITWQLIPSGADSERLQRANERFAKLKAAYSEVVESLRRQGEVMVSMAARLQRCEQVLREASLRLTRHHDSRITRVIGTCPVCQENETWQTNIFAQIDAALGTEAKTK